MPAFVALLVLADVLSFGTSMPTTRTRPGQAEEFYPRSPLVDFLTAGLEGHRFLAVDDVHAWWNDQNQPELWANRAMLAGLRDARGYYPLCLRWFGHFVNAMSQRPPRYPMGGLLSVHKTLHPALLSMLDVKFLLSYENLAVPGLRLARTTDFGLKIYEVASRRGPAFWVRSYPAAGLTDEEEIALITSPDFDVQNYALASWPQQEMRGKRSKAEENAQSAIGNGPSAVRHPPPEIQNRKSKIENPGAVHLARPTPNRIELHVELQSAIQNPKSEMRERAASGLVVVSEAYHPGWKAMMDGRCRNVVRANHALIGVPIPSLANLESQIQSPKSDPEALDLTGRYRITLTFEPATFRVGLYLSFGAWGVLVAMGVAALGRRSDRRMPRVFHS